MADPILTPNAQALKDASADLSKTLEAVAAAQQAGQLQPGAGGWTPPAWLPVVGSVVLAALAAAGVVVAAPAVTPAVIIGALSVFFATGGGTFMGIKSAGPRAS